MSSVTRTFRIVRRDHEYLPGISDGEERFDVSSFSDHGDPLTFRAEEKPDCGDFLVKQSAWESLGKPERISVTVEALA